MPRHASLHVLALGQVAILLSGCASQTIAPDYSSNNPNLQVGGDAPVDPGPVIEPAGVFCLEVFDEWHKDGETPDGEPLYARDTRRRAVSCDAEKR